MSANRKTGDGITLQDQVCDKCRQTKPCLQGYRQEGKNKPTIVYRCPECFDAESEKYLASLTTE